LGALSLLLDIRPGYIAIAGFLLAGLVLGAAIGLWPRSWQGACYNANVVWKPNDTVYGGATRAEGAGQRIVCSGRIPFAPTLAATAR
jgi:hypothetical protein